MPLDDLPDPPSVNLDWALRKCEYFTDTQLWPLRTHIDAKGWIENFEPEELDHAAHLLNAVVYLNEPLIERLFVSAFQGLSQHLGCPREPSPAARTRWRRFVEDAFVTTVTGEDPGLCDSGNHFARIARKSLGISEDRILDNAALLDRILDGTADQVVFVDDFVGSGSQLGTTWHRQCHVG